MLAVAVVVFMSSGKLTELVKCAVLQSACRGEDFLGLCGAAFFPEMFVSVSPFPQLTIQRTSGQNYGSVIWVYGSPKPGGGNQTDRQADQLGDAENTAHLSSLGAGYFTPRCSIFVKKESKSR